MQPLDEMMPSRSLRQFLGTYSLVFVVLNLGGLAFSAGLLWVWGESSREALRLTEMIAVLKEMRGTVYRQVKEAFDARFLGDTNAEKQYRELAEQAEHSLHTIEALAQLESERISTASVRLSYSEIAGRITPAFAATGTNDALTDLDADLEQRDFRLYEQALAIFESDLVSRRAREYQRAHGLLTLLPLLLAIPLLSSVVTLFWSRRYLARNIVEPLRDLESAIRGLPHSATLPHPTNHAVSEIRHVAETFAQMATELQHSRQALVRGEKDAALAALVPVLAHNIRNPLASIRAAAQVSDTPTLDVETRDTLRAIVRTTDRIEQWTRTMLSFLGPMQPRLEPCDLRQLCDTAIELLRAHFVETATTIARSGWQESLPLLADPVLLEQALQGLIANAVEASPPRAAIHVTLGSHEGRPRVAIEDHGPGIPFRPTPGEAGLAPSTKRYGTGLGIPFAMRVCELHGATIAFERIEPNGTRVSIQFRRQNEGGDTAG